MFDNAHGTNIHGGTFVVIDEQNVIVNEQKVTNEQNGMTGALSEFAMKIPC